MTTEVLTAEFQPRIACFVCNWGAYGGVEMAGINREEYPAGIRLVRVACIGRVHPGLILRAFELGADGVMLLRCPPEDCHYDSSAELARDMLTRTGKTLDLLGIGAERLVLVEVPLGRSDILTKEVAGFVTRIRRAGLSPLSPGSESLRSLVVGHP